MNTIWTKIYNMDPKEWLEFWAKEPKIQKTKDKAFLGLRVLQSGIILNIQNHLDKDVAA